MEPIPVFKPYYDEREIEAVAEVLRSGWIGLGPKTAAFERSFGDYLGTPHTVAVNSGTAALHLACILENIGPGDEVIVPALTFASTAIAPLYFGADLVFADVEESTLTIDPEDILKKITPRTKLIMAVHYGGTPADMGKISQIAKERNISVIEDAAHACGSKFNERKIGSLGNITTFSFHAVKNLATGDGGMIVLRNNEEYQKAKKLRWVGIDKDTWARENRGENRYDWYYEIRELGYKYHMNDISAALGIVQLSKLDEANKKRREIADLYRLELVKYDWMKMTKLRDCCESAQHNFVVRMKNREDFRSFLSQNNISTGVHYTPLTKQPLFSKYDTTLPVTDNLYEEIVTLPLYPGLKEEELQYIFEVIAAYDKTLSSKVRS